MRAVTIRDTQLIVEEHPDPAPGAGEVLIAVKAAGLNGADMHQLAAELAPMVDVWKRLLAQHVPDKAGRCIVCTKGGTGLPSRPWPCSIHATPGT